MMALGIHLLVLLSLPLVVLGRQYQVLIEPNEPDLCLLFTVANGGDSAQPDAKNPGRIGCFDPEARKCSWEKTNCEPSEDRCDPNLSKEKFTEQMVREIRGYLSEEHNVWAAMIIRHRTDPNTEEDTWPGSTSEEWVAFDQAIIDLALHTQCLGRRGLTLDFIARDPDHCGNIISLGYLISGDDLRKDQEDELNDKIDESSIRALGYEEKLRLPAMIRGSGSLGKFLSDAFTPDDSGLNITVVPSPQHLKPDADKIRDPCYYKGGYTVRHFGSCCNTLKFDAIQVAIPENLMDGASNRDKNAKSIADGIHKFIAAMHLI